MARSAKSPNDAHRALWCVLDVGSLKVSVYLVDRDKFASVMVDDEGVPAVGMWIAEMMAIFIGWDLPHDFAEQTLVHEIGHADEYVNGHSHDHDTLNAITACMYGTLRRNSLLRFPPRPVTPEDRRRVRKAKQMVRS